LLQAAAGAARELLSEAPGLKVLATSRAPLGLAGEAVWQLKPLELPRPGRPPEHAESVRLFTARARSAKPGLKLEGPDLEAAAHICRRLDGIPLALELAAPMLRHLSLRELANAAQEMAWEGGAAGRHGNLQQVLDWSYQLLRPEEQALFRKLGVFAGWFEAEDAAAVAGMESVFGLLGSLAEQSMLVVDTSWRWGSRYRLLDLLRTFARSRLAEAGELEDVQMALARRMLRLAALYQRLAAEATDARLPSKMEAQVDDVRSALTTLLDRDPAEAAMLVSDLASFWDATARAAEELEWTTAAVAANPKPSRARCWALFGQSWALLRLGRMDESEYGLAEAERLSERADCSDLANIIQVGGRAQLESAKGRYEEALEVMRVGLERCMASGNLDDASFCLTNMASLSLSLGRTHEALDLGERSLDLKRRLKHPRAWHSLVTLALAYVEAGEPARAWSHATEALQTALKDEESSNVVESIELLALLHGTEGRPERGLVLRYFATAWFEAFRVRRQRLVTNMVDRAVVGWEKSIGVSEAERLAAEGRELTVEAALELALSGARG
jgi:predicted ATPase